MKLKDKQETTKLTKFCLKVILTSIKIYAMLLKIKKEKNYNNQTKSNKGKFGVSRSKANRTW